MIKQPCTTRNHSQLAVKYCQENEFWKQT